MKMYSAVGFKKKGNSEGHRSAFVKYQLRIQPHLAEPANRTQQVTRSM